MSEKITPERKRRLDSLFEALSIVGEDIYVYLCDMYYDYSRWSKVLVEEFGLPSEYMYNAGSIWEEHIHPEDRATYSEGIKNVFAGIASGHDMQYRARKQDGEYEVCTCRGIVVYDEAGHPEYFGGAIRNHSAQSHIDSLTGLRNQYGFFEDVQTYIRNKINVRLGMIGIGKLTEINEVYGYHVGNAVLQYFGRYLMDNLGNRGSTYRLDGGKFAIITTNQTIEDVTRVYENLRYKFREGIRVKSTYISLELNSGTLNLDDFNTDDQTVYTCLNFAYDESKVNRHGDLVEFHNELSGKNKQRIEKLHVIRNSIYKGFEGFYLLYQPVVEASTERIIGAEALLRWRNEEHGVVPPDMFIPVLERDPKFPVLGEWILETALQGAKKIIEYIPDLTINVNLSYAQMEKTDFVDTVRNIIKRNDFKPERLCLEVTERCRLLDLDLLRNVVIALRAGGVKIALDDFGTGFSSIGILKNIPFDTIKIDRSFVTKIEEDEMERKLINTFTTLAGIYGSEVCIEGIETAGMRDILRKYGIHSFQGYYYSRPVELDEFLAKVTK
jgi:diguanylate cyclase (GGDEF)-like protein